MANPATLPRSNAQVTDQHGWMTKEWRDFFLLLASQTENNELRQMLLDLAERVSELEDIGGSFTINGPYSVQVLGSPSSGSVALQLRGDTNFAGPTFAYGTNAAGAKGWFPIADALAAGDNITLSVGVDGVTTIATTGGGVLPIVTGEIDGGQPVFVYGPDGSLVYGPVA